MEAKEPGSRAIAPATPDHEHLPRGARVHGIRDVGSLASPWLPGQIGPRKIRGYA